MTSKHSSPRAQPWARRACAVPFQSWTTATAPASTPPTSSTCAGVSSAGSMTRARRAPARASRSTRPETARGSPSTRTATGALSRAHWAMSVSSWHAPTATSGPPFPPAGASASRASSAPARPTWATWRTLRRSEPNSSASKRDWISAKSVGPLRRSSMPTPRSRSSTRRLSLRLRRTSSAWSRRACPRLPPTSSARASRLSSPSKRAIHCAAVFGPTPGTPGRLSLASPTRAATSG